MVLEESERAGAGPPFLTCEMLRVEGFTLKLECLTGWEEGLAPALPSIESVALSDLKNFSYCF